MTLGGGQFSGKSIGSSNRSFRREQTLEVAKKGGLFHGRLSRNSSCLSVRLEV